MNYCKLFNTVPIRNIDFVRELNMTKTRYVSVS